MKNSIKGHKTEGSWADLEEVEDVGGLALGAAALLVGDLHGVVVRLVAVIVEHVRLELRLHRARLVVRRFGLGHVVLVARIVAASLGACGIWSNSLPKKGQG